MNVYVELSRLFNEGRPRAILAGGQAVVLHRLAIRLLRYQEAAQDWARAWPDLVKQTAGRPLSEAHRLIVARAEGVLPLLAEGGLR